MEGGLWVEELGGEEKPSALGCTTGSPPYLATCIQVCTAWGRYPGHRAGSLSAWDGAHHALQGACESPGVATTRIRHVRHQRGWGRDEGVVQQCRASGSRRRCLLLERKPPPLPVVVGLPRRDEGERVSGQGGVRALWLL